MDSKGKKSDCEHECSCADWLPILKEKEESTLAPHPYCNNCGLVRNIGPDRAKKTGYFTDILSELERYLRHEHSKGARCKLTEAQKRLISNEMEEDELFNDRFGNLASSQKERFVEIVLKYRPDLKRREIEYFVEGE